MEMRESRDGNGTGSENPPHSFPLDVLPQRIRLYAEAVQVRFCATADMVGLPLLGVASAAVGRSVELEIDSCWTEGCPVYVVSIAPAGSGKSPIGRMLLDPLQSIARARRQRYLDERKQYERDVERYTAQRKKGDPTAEEPEPPTIERLITTDATVEALIDLLDKNPRGLLLWKDEISGWIKEFNRYRGGQGSDREFFLSSWAGATIKLDRKTEGASRCVHHPHLTIVGFTVPANLHLFHNPEGVVDGFAERILFSLPERDVWASYSPHVIPEEILKVWDHAVREMVAWKMRVEEDGQKAPQKTRFDEQAYRLFLELEDEKKRIVKHCEPSMRAFLAKQSKHLIRFALLLHALDCADDEAEPSSRPIDRQTLERADRLTTYAYGAWGRARAGSTESPEARQYRQICEWIARRDGGRTTLRELVRYRVAQIDSTIQMRGVLSELERQQRVAIMREPQKGGTHWDVQLIDEEDDDEGTDE